MKLVILIAMLVVLAAAGPAMAQSPTQDAYGGALGEQVTNGRGDAGAAPAETRSIGGGSLPFTGFEAGMIALAGAALVGVGYGLRRTTRRPGT